MSNMLWYAVHTTTGYENKVRDRILEQIVEKHLQDSFGEILVPSEEVLEMRAGKKIKTTRRLLPGYVFIQMKLSDEQWHFIRKIKNVTGFIGGVRPAPMKQSEIDSITQRAQESKDKPMPKVNFSIEEVVRIKHGAFADFNGRVANIDYDKAKLRLMVQVFGRETSCEIGFQDVEKI